MVYWLIPGAILQSINFQLQVFIQAQGINWSIGAANVLTLIVVVLSSNWLMYDLHVGILIFPICKLVMETMNFIGVLVGLYFIEKGSMR